MKPHPNTKHGQAIAGRRGRAYRTWEAMKSRCVNKANPAYKDYGGRGITFDPKWITFHGFYSDMGERPQGMSLDRIDNNSNYCKENCRWASRGQQARNKRNNKIVVYKSKSMTVAELADVTGVDFRLLHDRLRHGWSVEKAVGEPLHTNHHTKAYLFKHGIKPDPPTVSILSVNGNRYAHFEITYKGRRVTGDLLMLEEETLPQAFARHARSERVKAHDSMRRHYRYSKLYHLSAGAKIP